MSIESTYSVRPATLDIVRPWLLHKHYAHRIPAVSYAFALYTKETGECVGALTYGLPAVHNIVLCCGTEYAHRVIELNRLIKKDGLPKNTSSWFVAQSFQYLEPPKIIVSYADPGHEHIGFTYQALNFLYTGIGSADTEFVTKDGKVLHRRHIKEHMVETGRFDDSKTISQNWEATGGTTTKTPGKHRYILFLGNKRETRDMRKKLKWPTLPYPKGTPGHYDTSSKMLAQSALF